MELCVLSAKLRTGRVMVRKECHAEITVLVTNECKDKQQLH